eukprot:9481090-Pyramimonas_sp.AAC.1
MASGCIGTETEPNRHGRATRHHGPPRSHRAAPGPPTEIEIASGGRAALPRRRQARCSLGPRLPAPSPGCTWCCC